MTQLASEVSSWQIKNIANSIEMQGISQPILFCFSKINSSASQQQQIWLIAIYMWAEFEDKIVP